MSPGITNQARIVSKSIIHRDDKRASRQKEREERMDIPGDCRYSQNGLLPWFFATETQCPRTARQSNPYATYSNKAQGETMRALRRKKKPAWFRGGAWWVAMKNSQQQENTKENRNRTRHKRVLCPPLLLCLDEVAKAGQGRRNTLCAVFCLCFPLCCFCVSMELDGVCVCVWGRAGERYLVKA